MIGHNNPIMKNPIFTNNNRFGQFIFNDFPISIQYHFTLINRPKNTIPVLGYKGNKIDCLTGIIPIFQSIRFNTVFIFK